ncbi:MAG: hypothetical protein ACI8V2_001427 [Candidatus Latescibacterota bacterium]|jgi:DNA-directed RNA polymerase subunit K/omega
MDWVCSCHFLKGFFMPKVYFTEEVTGKHVNPYEAVLLSSREARRLNQARLNAGVPEGEEKVTTVAMGRLIGRKIRHTYLNDEQQGEGDATSGEKGSSRR